MNIIKTNIINDFLIFVIEEYKYLESKSIKDIIDLFTKKIYLIILLIIRNI